MVVRSQFLRALGAGGLAGVVLLSLGCHDGTPSAVGTVDLGAAHAQWAAARLKAIADAGGGPLKPLSLSASPTTVEPRVLMYHDIVAGGAIADRVDVGQFQAQMDYLRQADYTTVSAEDYYAAYRGIKPLPPKSVMLSFDDSDEGQYRYAAPILKAHGFKATFFVLPAMTDKHNHMTWPQMRALDRTPGFRLYSHTNLHEILTTLKTADQERELRDSRQDLERHLGGRRDIFAYPNGAYDLAVMALTERYYKMAFAVGGNTLPGVAPHLQIPRIGIGADVTTLAQFRDRLEGHRVVAAEPADMREALTTFPSTVRAASTVKLKKPAIAKGRHPKPHAGHHPTKHAARVAKHHH